MGLDSINDYYDPALKNARVAVLRKFNNFSFHKIDLADRKRAETIFRNGEFGPVVHLAAQASVRYSLQSFSRIPPDSIGTEHALEEAKTRCRFYDAGILPEH